MSAVIRATVRGNLATMLVLIIVARIPEATPLSWAGTEPITELALGLRNRPIPKPTTAKHVSMNTYEVVTSIPDNRTNPADAIPSPRVLSPLEPYLSDSVPLIGPIIIKVASRGIRAIPAETAE